MLLSQKTAQQRRGQQHHGRSSRAAAVLGSQHVCCLGGQVSSPPASYTTPEMGPSLGVFVKLPLRSCRTQTNSWQSDQLPGWRHCVPRCHAMVKVGLPHKAAGA